MANAQTQQPEKTVTVVINNGSGMELVQLPHRGQDGHKRVILGDAVRFLPGVNLVDTEQLAILRKNPLFEAKFTNKIPRIAAPEQKQERVGRPFLTLGKTLPSAHPLSKLSE